jgi:hemoglobin-like flavoprotein
MDELPPKDRFIQSLDRCSGNADFIPAFYDRFLSVSDEIRHKFRHTDFEQQNQMLLRSLSLAADATSGKPESLRELRERAETHDRHHLNIEPHLYSIWLDCVVETASEFDTEWNESTEEAWKAILGHVIKHMTKHY